MLSHRSSPRGRSLLPLAPLVCLSLAAPLTVQGAGSPSGAAAPSTPAPDSSAAAADADASGAGPPQQVIVTAQKLKQDIMRVPVPVTVLHPDTLTAQGEGRLEDYMAYVPGVALTASDQGTPAVSMRGITTGPGYNPTVAILIDDLPVTSSIVRGLGEYTPDIDPFDLARIEVLRGPQGTLYGASSLAGLIKYVTRDPSTSAFTGSLTAGTSSVYHGAEAGYSARGAVNLPLTDTLAASASAFTREDPGYVDNPLLGQRGTNEGRTSGGRLASLWTPEPGLSVKLAATYQHMLINASPEVDVGAGLAPLQHTDIAGTGGLQRQLQLYSATVNAALPAGAKLTSVTGYVNHALALSTSVPSFAALTEQLFGVSGVPDDIEKTDRTLSQELRLTGDAGALDYLIGAYFKHEVTTGPNQILAANPITGVVVGQWLYQTTPTLYTETAAFADLTVRFSRAFAVQLGARYSAIDEDFETSIATGPYDTVILHESSPLIQPAITLLDHPLTYLFTPSWQITDDVLLYVRAASGFRPGGPNVIGLKPYLADTTRSTELGLKADVLQHALQLDASIYNIDWKDIQLTQLLPSGLSGFTNASGAQSDGAELSAQSARFAGLMLHGWVTYTDARITAAFPPTATLYAPAGSPLPSTARWAGLLGLDDEQAFGRALTGSVGATATWTGDRPGEFVTRGTQREIYPGYLRLDLNASLTYSSYRAVLAVTNATNRYVPIAGGTGTTDPAAFYYITPRTISLTLTDTF